MNDLEIINHIQKANNIKIKKFQTNTLNKHVKNHYTIGYEVNNNNEIVSLALDKINLDYRLLKDLKQLTSLSLCNNQINNIEFIKNLKHITYLDLRRNQIKDIEALKELKNLSSLHLANNQIHNIEVLKDLKDLSFLYLGGNQIKNTAVLKDLKKLTSLYLGFNKITDIEFLRNLKNLYSLDLSFNEISEIEILKNLKNLKTLDLSFNKIKDFEVLKNLEKLTDLDISSNKAKSIEGLQELKNITTLDLSFNILTDIEIIKELANISSLRLISNQIIDIEVLKNLKNLTYLDLGNNQIKDIEGLKDLKNLTFLSISNNQISDIETIKDFKNLMSLNLSSNQIKDFTIIKNLKNLTSISLSNNQINDIAIIKDLKNLSSLDLSFNLITDINVIKDLKYLTSLNLSNNQIKEIDVFLSLENLTSLKLNNIQIKDFTIIKNLKHLTSLELNSNQIKDIEFLKDLNNLNNLELNSNQIEDIEMLKELKNITSLDLSSNQIKDIKGLMDLKDLDNLDLRHNQITEIPRSITSLSMTISLEENFYKGILLFDNPIKRPDIETIKQGKEAIDRYWTRLGKEIKTYLYEAKLTLVGDGGAGKTSLCNRLINPKSELPKEDKRTRGIELNNWLFSDEDKNYIAHIWDFGGQDMYYPVHRFFLTDGSVFVLLSSTRHNDHNFDYWIPTIHQFGKDSPIIIVQNCFDHVEKNWNDITTYLGNTEFNIIKTNKNPYYRIDLPLNNKGLEEIKKEITKQLTLLPHFGKIVPQTWSNLRQIISELKDKNLITYEQFEKEYKKLDTDDLYSLEDIKDSARFFHNLGIILWYHENNNLNDTVIINPQWALSAVYKIIDDKEICNGRITESDFNRVWSDNNIRNQHRVLKHMLESFKIAFPLKHDNSVYLIPVLQKSIPKNDVWINNENCLRLEYRYDFMPKGLVNQLSAELSKYTKDNEVWNNAVNFYYDNEINSKCQVIENTRDRNITIKAYGTNPIQITSKVQNALESITEAYRGVSPEILIPCICTQCKNNADAESFTYSKLIKKLHEKGPQALMACNESDEQMLIIDLLYNTGFNEVIESTKQENDRKLHNEITEIGIGIKELKKDHQIIISELERHFNFLMDLSINKVSKQEIEELIIDLNKVQTKEIGDNLVIYLSEAFEHFKGDYAEEFKVILGDMKETSNFEMKLKLAIPLLNLIGVNIETEFDIKNWMKQLYEKHGEKIEKLRKFIP